MSNLASDFHLLHGHSTSAVIDMRSGMPALLYFGRRLSRATTPDMLATLAARAETPGAPAQLAPITLSPLLGEGWPGSPGISGHAQGRAWGLYPRIAAIEPDGESSLLVRARDATHGIEIVHRLRLFTESDVLVASAEVINAGTSPFQLDQCAALTLPVPDGLTRILSYEGRWAGEFQTRALERFMGAYVRESRRGRTSHDSFPALVIESEHCTETQGEALGLHLGWSGNHRLVVENLPDGRGYAQLGELFLPGEMRLQPGARYRSPD
ncbi:MAG: alpha-galactosidase, partial [Alphaproteobacteria bacterium]